MKRIIKSFLCIVLLLLIIRLSFYGILYVGIFLHDKYPAFFYEGDKTVPENDIIYLEKLSVRDLRLDMQSKYNDGTTYYRKCYIVKKNYLSKKKIYQLLSNYCKEYYKNHNSYDEVGFFFYEECGRMPWFWINDGFFPDLEINSNCLICRFFISKEEVKFFEGGE